MGRFKGRADGPQVHPDRVTGSAAPKASASSHYSQREGRWDEFKLWGLGYKQEFPRTFTFFNCFASGFSIMSIFTLVESYSLQGLTYGGPVVVIWGWIAVGLLTLCVAASMGELLSAFPTAGGLYYWCWILAPPSVRGVCCWVTGFLNLAGQIAFTASTDVALSRFIMTLITLHTVGADGSPGYVLTPVQLMLLFLAIITIHALMNSLSQQFTSLCITFSGLWHIVAATAFIVVLTWQAPSYNDSKFVWFDWQPNTAITGISSAPYIVLVGLLMASWTMTGFDVIVNVCEETINADVAASWAIPASVLATLVMGLGFLLSLTYSLQSIDNLFDPASASGGKALAQLTWDVHVARYGSGRGAIPLLYVPAIGLFMCGFVCMMSGGRTT